MKELSRELIKVDRNGTKYFRVTEVCEKCNGTGNIDYYKFYDNGVCFNCNGTGYTTRTEKVMTEEYSKKLEERRRKRQEKKDKEMIEKAGERNKEFFIANGFDENGNAFAVLGNTFAIKDKLKELGCKWCYLIKSWITPVKLELEGHELLKINVDSLYLKDNYNMYNKMLEANEESNILRKKIEKLNSKNSNSEYIGEVKERITLDAELDKVRCFDTMYGMSYIYIFKNGENIIVWKTSKCLDTEVGDKIKITGTVKEHKEYNGVKQTMLTRCKIA